MQIIENSKIKEKLYIDKLDNGLTIMVLPKKTRKKSTKKTVDKVVEIEDKK